MPDMKGKVVVVTGGNAGIGLQTVKHFAMKGAKVYYTARSEAKSKHTTDYVLSQSTIVSKDKLVWLKMDLSDLKSVMHAVEELKSREQSIDILVNNAGIVMDKFETTDAGWEMAMAVCHIGHFVFTNGILPLLKKAAASPGADVRIVTVSSSVTYVFFPPNYQFDFTSPAFLSGTLPYSPWQWRYLMKHMFTIDMMRYSLAKVANLIFAQELQRRLDEQGSSIISLSVHPGSVRSANALQIFSALLKPVMRRVMVTEDEGSFTLLFGATAKEVRETPNAFKADADTSSLASLRRKSNMAGSTGNYTLVRGTGFIQRLWYLYHRLGIWSNILISAEYRSSNGSQLTKPAIIAALRTVVQAHPALWHVFVQRPSSKKGCHGLHTAALRVLDLEQCIEYLDDEDDAGITSETLERLHNEWLWTADEPGSPWWKVVVKGHNIVFVYHHSIGDGISGIVFHREFLAALNSTSANKLGVEHPQKTILYANDNVQIALEPTEVWTGKPSIPEMIWTQLVCWFFKLFYGSSRIYGNLPPSKPCLKSATAVAEPSQRTVTRISSYRIPAAKMAQIIAACRSNQTTFTPLLMTMLTIVLGTDYYPEAKIGLSRYAFDIRPQLPMSRIGGGTSNGTIINATASGEHWHWLGPFRSVLTKNKLNGSSLDSSAVWALVRDYKEGMTRHTTGKGIRSWIGVNLMGSDLEDVVKTAFPSISLLLNPTYAISNVGAFFGKTEGEDTGNARPWQIEDLQFSAAAVNGTQGTHGAIFHVAGVKGGDTVVNATYEDGVITREMAEGILERVMAGIYSIV
ncbi:hypothetical protein G7Z17_g1539 [Cylindrodendrum hubeiense]|uniref:Uncharacterized protein n=1 Tax=Cylindrodendrum hubeiense TaxID=595255 RepID=A0A9P5LLZ0_9HYPO|nr:hypothetical protein G7Z17_g1539 [Cylindrodendrum hubeiense]